MRLPVLNPADFRPARARLDADFRRALGGCIASFGDLEDALLKLSWRLQSGGRDVFSEIDAVEAEKLTAKFRKAVPGTLGARIALLRESLLARWGAEQPELADLLDELDRALRLRNMLAHTSWRVTGRKGVYRAVFIDRDRVRYDREYSAAELDEACGEIGELLMRLFRDLWERDPDLLDPGDHEALPGATFPEPG